MIEIDIRETERIKEQKKKFKRISKDFKIKKIGGRLFSLFNDLKNEVDDIDKETFVLYDSFRFLNIDLNTYLKIAEGSRYELFNLYREYCFNEFRQDIKEGRVSKYKEYETPQKTETCLKNKASHDFMKIVKETNLPFAHHVTTKQRRFIHYFKDSLVLDPEYGLIIDGKKFVEKYEDMTKAEQTRRYQLHENAVKAINQFFEGSVITWEELQRFFSIDQSKGKIMVNPEAITEKNYLRLYL